MQSYRTLLSLPNFMQKLPIWSGYHTFPKTLDTLKITKTMFGFFLRVEPKLQYFRVQLMGYFMSSIIIFLFYIDSLLNDIVSTVEPFTDDHFNFSLFTILKLQFMN